MKFLLSALIFLSFVGGVLAGQKYGDNVVSSVELTVDSFKKWLNAEKKILR